MTRPSRRLVAAAPSPRSPAASRRGARAARLHLLDAIGVGLAAAAARRRRASYLWRCAALDRAQAGRANIFGSDAPARRRDAALVNGGLIHSLEYDDTHTGSIVHGSAVLAAGRARGGRGGGRRGATVSAAYVLGWEVLVRLGLAAPGGFQRAGISDHVGRRHAGGGAGGGGMRGLDEDAARRPRSASR